MAMYDNSTIVGELEHLRRTQSTALTAPVLVLYLKE